jgi:hypothetical protein
MRYLLFLPLLFCLSLQAQDITGRWVTIDDNTGKRRSVVEINVKNGASYWSCRSLLPTRPNEDQDPICDICHR